MRGYSPESHTTEGALDNYPRTVRSDGRKIIINKPAYMGIDTVSWSVRSVVEQMRKADDSYTICGLEKAEYSGLVLLGTEEDKGRLLRQRASGKIGRTYIVMVNGEFPNLVGTIGPVGRKERAGIALRQLALLCDQEGEWKTLLQVQTRTSDRDDPLESYFEGLGYPVTGSSRLFNDQQLLRSMVHAYEIVLGDPNSKKARRFRASLEPDFFKYLSDLELLLGNRQYDEFIQVNLESWDPDPVAS